ncbi:MAG: FUSC family protein [Pseudomonadota bacterium]
MIAPSAWLHAVRYGVAAGVACGVSEVVGLHHLFWVLLTIGLVLQERAGETMRRSWQRIGGTFVGAILGWAIATALGPGHELWLLSAIPPILIGIFLFVPVNYFVGVVFITLLVIFFYAIEGMPTTAAASQRAVDTVVAATLGIAVSLLIQPTFARDKVKEALPQYLRIAAARLRQEVRSIAEGRPSLIEQDYQAFVAEAHQLSKSMAAARWETIPWTPVANRHVLCAEIVSAFYRRIASLHGLVDPRRSDEFDEDLARMVEAADCVAELLQNTAENIRSRDSTKGADIQAVRRTVERAAIDALSGQADRASTSSVAARNTVFFAELLALVDDTAILAKALRLPVSETVTP